MSSPVILGFGLLILLANLSFAALFAPSFRLGAGSPGARLRRVWRIFGLALLQIGAWAVMFYNGGAVDSPEGAFEEALGTFALVGGGPDSLVGPWSALIPFVALNGLLFLPVSLISGFVPELRVVTAVGDAKGQESPVNASQTQVQTVSPVATEKEFVPPPLPSVQDSAKQEPVSVAETVPETACEPTVPSAPPQMHPQAAADVAATVPVRRNEPFRGSLPPIQLPPQPEIELPTFSPDRPPERIPPSPPPIRFN